eukprot:EC834060.1.p3 GENE.EC834060.1~~EC834060.1.p3  ORF type:complete len:92 (+),score=1.95 EC834060.1:98-373(+)
MSRKVRPENPNKWISQDLPSSKMKGLELLVSQPTHPHLNLQIARIPHPMCPVAVGSIFMMTGWKARLSHSSPFSRHLRRRLILNGRMTSVM